MRATRRSRDGTEERRRRRRPLALARAAAALAPWPPELLPMDDPNGTVGKAHLEDRVLRVLVDAAASPLVLLLLLPLTAAVASDAADAGDPLFLLFEVLL